MMTRYPNQLPPFPPLPDERVAHFALEGLLPPTQVFALNPTLRILTRLAYDQRLHPLVLGEQQFSRQEMNLLYPLLSNYPAHTPHEVLYASFNYGGYARLDERTIERARTYLSEVRTIPGLWGVETHPIARTLSRARPGLRELGLDYVLIFETGYVLDVVSSR